MLKEIKTNKGFTLIELLVVVAIISLLSSIVFASLNSARAKARDVVRMTEVKQLETALESYYLDNGNFPSGCATYWCCLGHGDSGTCWNHAYPGNTAIDNALSPKYISKIPDDPLNNTSKYGDAFMYGSDGSSAILHWGIENTNPTAAKDCLGGGLGQWAAGMGNGNDYYCMYTIR